MPVQEAYHATTPLPRHKGRNLIVLNFDFILLLNLFPRRARKQHKQLQGLLFLPGSGSELNMCSGRNTVYN